MNLADLKKDISFQNDTWSTYKILYKKEPIGLVSGNSWGNNWKAFDTLNNHQAWDNQIKRTGYHKTRFQAAVALLQLQNKIKSIDLNADRVSHIDNNRILSVEEVYANDDQTQIMTRALIAANQGNSVRNIMITVDLNTQKVMTLSQKPIKIDNLDELLTSIKKKSKK